ncbi:Trehalose transport system permease protein SugB [compost metagenome]
MENTLLGKSKVLKPYKPRGKWWQGPVNILLSLYAMVTLYPLFWLFTSAFKTNEEFDSRPFSLPQVWNWDNLVKAWEVSAMGTSLINSTIVTVLALIFTITLGALAAYVLARFEFKMKGFIMGLFLLGMLIPIHSTLVPLFIILKKINLLDTYWALVLPYTAFELPLAIFITVAFLLTIPKEIEEAALIDGTGYWGIFFRMMLPLSLPALSTVAILGFLRFWNDFAFALIFISKPALKTVPLSLSVFRDGYSTDYKLTMAAMTIAVVPTIVAFLMFQEQIMKGMTAGAVKG